VGRNRPLAAFFYIAAGAAWFVLAHTIVIGQRQFRMV